MNKALENSVQSFLEELCDGAVEYDSSSKKHKGVIKRALVRKVKPKGLGVVDKIVCGALLYIEVAFVNDEIIAAEEGAAEWVLAVMLERFFIDLESSTLLPGTGVPCIENKISCSFRIDEEQVYLALEINAQRDEG